MLKYINPVSQLNSMRCPDKKNTARTLLNRLCRHVLLVVLYIFSIQLTALARQFPDTNTDQAKNPAPDPGNRLPLKLVEFGGRPSKDIVQLLWTTAKEKNVNHFELEKSSNGIHFVFINKQTGKGIASGAADYQAEDFKPAAGINYYRLKIVCNDGRFTYSKIIVVKHR